MLGSLLHEDISDLYFTTTTIATKNLTEHHEKSKQSNRTTARTSYLISQAAIVSTKARDLSTYLQYDHSYGLLHDDVETNPSTQQS